MNEDVVMPNEEELYAGCSSCVGWYRQGLRRVGSRPGGLGDGNAHEWPVQEEGKRAGHESSQATAAWGSEGTREKDGSTSV